MLFSKKKELTVTEKHLKEDICLSDGTSVVKVNLKYPELKCQKGNKLLLHAAPFYKSIANTLFEYAKTDLKNSALKDYNQNPNEFIPYSVVMRWENSYEDKMHLSVMTEISFFTKNGEAITERSAQVWSKADGKKCKILDFLSKEQIKEIKSKLPDEQKKFFRQEDFILREGKTEFFIKLGKEYTTLVFEN